MTVVAAPTHITNAAAAYTNRIGRTVLIQLWPLHQFSFTANPMNVLTIRFFLSFAFNQTPVQKYRVFPGGKERPGRDADPSPPSSAVGHEKVELYLYSPYGPYSLYRALVPVQGVHFTFTFFTFNLLAPEFYI